MKVVFGGACITSGTGKIGGTVIQGGPFGTIARTNFKPKNRNANNQFQPCEKEVFASVAKAWQSLTPTQITAWNSFAIPPLSGYQTWVKYQLQYFRINNSLLPSPPTLPVLPSSITLNSNDPTAFPNFKLNATYVASTNANTLHLFVSINNPNGRLKLIKSTLRLVATAPAIAGISNYLFNPSLFGVLPRTGMSQFIGVRLFDTITGVLCPLQTIQFSS